MLCILNNIMLGYKNNSKEWFTIHETYFRQKFNDIVNRKLNNNDIIIFTGKIFENLDNINSKIFLFFYDYIKKLSSTKKIIIIDKYNNESILKIFNENNNIIYTNQNILIDDTYIIIDNDFNNDKYYNNNTITIISEKINNHDFLYKKNNITLFNYNVAHDEILNNKNVIYDLNLFQINKNIKKIGFLIYKNNSYKIIKNNFSPLYKEIILNTNEDIDILNNIDDKKYIIDIQINKKLLSETNKIKIDYILSKINYNSISYIDDNNQVENKNLIIDNNNFIDITSIIFTEIKKYNNKELEIEFKNILNMLNKNK